ncbi:hypothetical protein ACFL27_19210 [candidate division CSSED10-310 bacterium]|uniref:PIN domain-containing protein n=1 Tax=candidate division CSSED10-310 bacterium TaxID=2855610 RepID=A0ABV6Z1K9_UNCC1
MSRNELTRFISDGKGFIDRYPPGAAIFADTSTIIYLAKIKLLRTLASTYSLILAPAVLKELSLEQSDLYPETVDIKLLIKQYQHNSDGEPEIYAAEQPDLERSPIKLQGGEREVVNLFHHQKLGGFVLTDDRKLMKYCKSNDIPFTSSIIIPCFLFRFELISYTSAAEAIEQIYRLGYFSQDILTIAQNLLAILLKIPPK